MQIPISNLNQMKKFRNVIYHFHVYERQNIVFVMAILKRLMTSIIVRSVKDRESIMD